MTNETALTIQYQEPNGSWVNAGERSEEFLGRSIDFHANHPNLASLTREQAEEALLAGKELHHREDWYAVIRNRPAPRVAAVAELVRANCGHTVARGSMMNASLGTSCPDCYDRMSA